jgi:hypothetical protein
VELSETEENDFERKYCELGGNKLKEEEVVERHIQLESDPASGLDPNRLCQLQSRLYRAFDE